MTTISATNISPKKIRVIGVPLDLDNRGAALIWAFGGARGGVGGALEALGHEVEDGGNVAVPSQSRKKRAIPTLSI